MTEKKFTIAKARAHLTDLLNEAAYAKDRIQIMRRNKPIAYIVPVEDVELLERLEDMLDVQEAESRQQESTVSLESLKKAFDL